MESLKRKNVCTAPVRIAQFGEGNFLRAFIDWMIQKLNQKTNFNGSVQIIQPLEKGMGDVINRQGGIYTLILRGMENGQVVEQTEIIESVRAIWELTVQECYFVRLNIAFNFTTHNRSESFVEIKVFIFLLSIN